MSTIPPAGPTPMVQTVAGPEPAKFDPMAEMGRSGLRRSGGFILEEFKPELQGQRGAKEYRSMLDNSSIVWSAYNALRLSLRRAKFDIMPFEGGKASEDAERAELLTGMFSDMSYSMDDTMSEICSMVAYGYAPMEIVYKKREGWQDDASKRSRYTDGLIGWRKLALRSQESVFQWDFDDEDGVRGMVQIPPPWYQQIYIPIEKLLLFRADATKNNPEGRSAIRSAYYEWYGLRRLLEIAWIGAERNVAGYPLGKVPASAFAATSPNHAAYTDMVKVGENIRADEQTCIVIPSDVDPETKVPLYSFELLKDAGGDKITGLMSLIMRHEQRIAMLLMQDWLLIGHEGSGSRALVDPKIQNAALAANAWLFSIGEVFNRHAIPRLWALNGWPMDRMASMQFGEVEEKDLAGLAAFLKDLSTAGVDIFPDEDLTRYLYTSAGLPTTGRDQLREEGLLTERKTPEEQAAEAALMAEAMGKKEPKDGEDPKNPVDEKDPKEPGAKPAPGEEDDKDE